MFRRRGSLNAADEAAPTLIAQSDSAPRIVLVAQLRTKTRAPHVDTPLGWPNSRRIRMPNRDVVQMWLEAMLPEALDTGPRGGRRLVLTLTSMKDTATGEPSLIVNGRPLRPFDIQPLLGDIGDAACAFLADVRTHGDSRGRQALAKTSCTSGDAKPRQRFAIGGPVAAGALIPSTQYRCRTRRTSSSRAIGSTQWR